MQDGESKAANIAAFTQILGSPWATLKSQAGSGAASKLHEAANFIETGMYARVRRAGLWAIKDRQKETTVKIIPPIRPSSELLADPFGSRPRCECPLWNSTQ